MTHANSGQGIGVDSQGNPVIDPTRNVLDLVQAAIKRQDDLRESEAQHTQELMRVHADYQGQLRIGEAERINAIRSVDVAAVQRAAEVQATQAGALAAQVSTTADAFRSALGAALEPIIRDIADLRKAQYEQAGQKAQVVEKQAAGSQNGQWVAIAVAVMSLLVTIGVLLLRG